MFLFAASMGSLSREIDDMARDNPTLVKYLEAAGSASLTDSYFSTMLLIMAVLASGFAVSSTLRLRGEESAGRLEPLLATGLSRTRWLLGSLAVTVVGRRAAARRERARHGAGLRPGRLRREPAAPARRPGTRLRARGGGRWRRWRRCWWAGRPGRSASRGLALAVCFVLGWLGGLLDPPRWVQELSPFWHTPAVPVDPVTWSAPVVTAPGRRARRRARGCAASAAATC